MAKVDKYLKINFLFIMEELILAQSTDEPEEEEVEKEAEEETEEKTPDEEEDEEMV